MAVHSDIGRLNERRRLRRYLRGRPRWTGIIATRIRTGGPHAISLRYHRSCSCRLPGGASIPL